jgi:hypothetical protein
MPSCRPRIVSAIASSEISATTLPSPARIGVRKRKPSDGSNSAAPLSIKHRAELKIIAVLPGKTYAQNGIRVHQSSMMALPPATRVIPQTAAAVGRRMLCTLLLFFLSGSDQGRMVARTAIRFVMFC